LIEARPLRRYSVAKKTAPCGFSEDIAAKVCGLISEGLSLRKIQMKEGMPTKSAVLSWLLQGEAYKANGEPTNPKALFLHQSRAPVRFKPPA
jgi:hypothetical protein